MMRNPDSIEDVIEWVYEALAGETDSWQAYLVRNSDLPLYERTARLVADLWCIRCRHLGQNHGPLVPCHECLTEVRAVMWGDPDVAHARALMRRANDAVRVGVDMDVADDEARAIDEDFYRGEP